MSQLTCMVYERLKHSIKFTKIHLLCHFLVLKYITGLDPCLSKYIFLCMNKVQFVHVTSIPQSLFHIPSLPYRVVNEFPEIETWAANARGPTALVGPCQSSGSYRGDNKRFQDSHSPHHNHGHAGSVSSRGSNRPSNWRGGNTHGYQRGQDIKDMPMTAMT